MTHAVLDKYRSGSTEPWTVSILVALLNAIGAERILELGGYIGLTSEQFARHKLTSAELTVVELDSNRVAACKTRLEGFENTTVVQDDTEHFLSTYEGEPFDFVFVDDDHNANHVGRELDLLKARKLVRSGGLICCHDVYGLFGIAPVVAARGGFNLDLPQLHAAGGLGIIQIR